MPYFKEQFINNIFCIVGALKEKIAIFHSETPLFFLLGFYFGLIALLLGLAYGIYCGKSSKPIVGYDSHLEMLVMVWAVFALSLPFLYIINVKYLMPFFASVLAQ
jgi:hypothetical protein